MVKHMILWQLRDGLTGEEKNKIKSEIKNGLEGLAEVINGIVSIKVITEGLESSNADLMLDSTFENEEALKAYSVHPAHVNIAQNKVRPNTKNRVCMDYEA